MKEISVEVAKVEDAAEILEVIKKLGDETINYPFTSEDYGMDEKSQALFIDMMDKMENSLFLVAKYDQKVVGIFTLEGGKKYRTYHLANLGIGVLKEYWNKGIAKKLMSKGLTWAENGEYIGKIDLQVVSENKVAVDMYKKFGFQVEGRIKRSLFIDGEFFDYIQMGKEID